jgi:hypothetical protein
MLRFVPRCGFAIGPACRPFSQTTSADLRPTDRTRILEHLISGSLASLVSWRFSLLDESRPGFARQVPPRSPEFFIPWVAFVRRQISENAGSCAGLFGGWWVGNRGAFGGRLPGHLGGSAADDGLSDLGRQKNRIGIEPRQ